MLAAHSPVASGSQNPTTMVLSGTLEESADDSDWRYQGHKDASGTAPLVSGKTRPLNRPNKLQKSRRDALAPPPQGLTRTGSLDIASLSDNSHRALVNAQFAISTRYPSQYRSSNAQKAVLKKRRDSARSRPATYQPAPSPDNVAFTPQDQSTHAQPQYQKPLPDPYATPLNADSYYHDDQIPSTSHNLLYDYGAAMAMLDGSDDISSTHRNGHKERKFSTTSTNDLPRSGSSTPIHQNGLPQRAVSFRSSSDSSGVRTAALAQIPEHEKGPPRHYQQTRPPPIEKDDHTRRLQRLVTEFITSQREYLQTLRNATGNDRECKAPVSLILALLSLIQNGEDFVQVMQNNPSPSGIAEAFLDNCSKLEAYLLEWAKEASDFADSRPSSEFGGGTRLSFYGAKGKTSSKSPFKMLSRLFKRKKPVGGASPGLKEVAPDKFWQRSSTGPGLWEITVLPIQRTMRYVVLFRELGLVLGTGHKDYQVVERAYNAAWHIEKQLTQT